jgi:peptide/nickel transport system substrate-binding protein
LTLVILACALGGVGCSSASNSIGQATLVYSREGEADVLDPIQTEVGETVKVVVNLFEPLVTYAEKSMEVVPCLATRWSMSDDGLAWTFELREGVRFHDGTLLNAEAVVFSFERLIRDNHPHAYTEVKPFVATYRVIDRVEADGPHRVVFHLKHPDAVFLHNMCMFAASIVSPTAVKESKADFGAQPVGTGPFRFGRWQRGVQLELLAFDDYWDGKPLLDRVIFVPGKESEIRARQMRRGEAHLADNLPPQIVDDLASAPNLSVQDQVGMNVGYISIQTEHPPLDDVRVRRAICHAIDKRRLIEEVYHGHAEPAVSMLPPSMWAHHGELEDYEYDPEQAKRLLAEAGVALPLKLSLFAMQTARPYMQQPTETAVFLKDQLARVGIELEIVTQENNVHFQRLNRGEHDLGLVGWSSDVNDPDNFLYQLLDPDNAHDHGNNNSRYRNARVHELLMAAKRQFDRPRREALYREVQEITLHDAPTVPLVHTSMRVVMNERVQDYYLHPASLERLRWTSLAKSGAPTAGSSGGTK